VVGIEPDLAADIAKRLGVKLELVPVGASNRIEFLQQGKVDLLIATMSDRPERRRVVQAIEPLYYSDYVNILSQKGRYQRLADLKENPYVQRRGPGTTRMSPNPTVPKSLRLTVQRSLCLP